MLTEKWADRQTNMTKLLVALCNFANTPKRHDVIATLLSHY